MAAHTAIAPDIQKAAYLGEELDRDQMLELICFDTPIGDEKIRQAMESNPDFPLLSQLAGCFIAKGWDENSLSKDLRCWMIDQLQQMEYAMEQIEAIPA